MYNLINHKIRVSILLVESHLVDITFGRQNIWPKFKWNIKFMNFIIKRCFLIQIKFITDGSFTNIQTLQLN